MNCRDVERYLHTYVDGEFSDLEETEIEQHFKFCPACQKKVAFHVWFKKGMKQSLPQYQAPQSLGMEVRHLISQERSRNTPVALRYAPAMAIILVFFGIFFFPRIEVSSPIVEASISRHLRNLPFDVQSNDLQTVQSYLQQRVNYAMHVPRFKKAGIQLEGGRITSVKDAPAVYLSYNINGRRCSLVAAPAEEDPSETSGGIRKVVNNREFWVTNKNGLNVVLWKRNNMVYSFVSDSPENEVITMASSVEYDF